jgi:hypothetical protein
MIMGDENGKNTLINRCLETVRNQIEEVWPNPKCHFGVLAQVSDPQKPQNKVLAIARLPKNEAEGDTVSYTDRLGHRQDCPVIGHIREGIPAFVIEEPEVKAYFDSIARPQRTIVIIDRVRQQELLEKEEALRVKR